MSNVQEQIPTGPAWAALLSAAMGCFTFGVAVDLCEASKAISAKLNLYNPTGDLSGKSTLAVVVWIIAWLILHEQWKNRTIAATGKLSAAIVLLVVLSLLATFPPIFGML